MFEENQQKIYCYVDESGTLPDVSDRFIAVCGVVVKDTKEAENLINSVLFTLHQTRDSLKLKELKFYHSRHVVKKIFLSAIVASGFKIFILVVDKQGRKIKDDPENFFIILTELISEIFLWYRGAKLDLIIDRHFTKNKDEQKLVELLRLNSNYAASWHLGGIQYIDSQSNLTVNIPDMCAGAVLRKYRHGDDRFYSIIKENILVEKITNWPELKRRKLGENKNSLEPA